MENFFAKLTQTSPTLQYEIMLTGTLVKKVAIFIFPRLEMFKYRNWEIILCLDRTFVVFPNTL